jgi:neutral ceramidase
MGGYGISLGGVPRTATGTHAPLLARVLVLWNSGTPWVVVGVDALGWSAAAATAVRQRVTTATGLPAARFLLAATHTHNAPALPGVLDPYMAYGLTATTAIDAAQKKISDGVVALVQSVLAGPRTPVTLDYQVTSTNFSFNREGLPYVETAVPVLVARGSSGRPVGVLFGYGTHPVAAGVQTEWDGDYASVAAGAIETTFPGSTALFLLGPAGDQDPVGVRGFSLGSTLGAQLGGVVSAAAAVPGRALTGVGTARLTTVDLPLDVTPTPANLAAVRDAYQVRTSSSPLGWEVRHAQTWIDLINRGASIPTTVPVTLQGWRFTGGTALKLAVVGGELVSGYAVYFRQRQGGTAGLWLGGYGPSQPAYLPSNELLPPLRAGGSYAGGWDTDFPGIAGGAMCVYGPLGHFLAGSAGIETTLINALNALLA